MELSKKYFILLAEDLIHMWTSDEVGTHQNLSRTFPDNVALELSEYKIAQSKSHIDYDRKLLIEAYSSS